MKSIVAALTEMGVIAKGKTAKDIRWQAVFLMGPAGSGKSTLKVQKYLKHLSFKNIDPDDLKKNHPNYDPENPMKLHDWSIWEADDQMYDIFGNGRGDPVIVDGTGRNGSVLLDKIKLAKSSGYRTYLVYVYVPDSVSLFRNRNRSRFVPEHVVMGQLRDVGKSFAMLKSKVDKAKVVMKYTKEEEREADEDMKLYPPPQRSRPPRPGDRDYGLTSIAASLVRIARQLLEG
jgi:predicted kinase